MNKSEYLRLMHQASEKKLRITKQMEREIRETYRNVAKDLERQIVKANPNSLNERWLYDYKKSLEREIDALTKSIYKTTKQKLEEVIELSNSPQLSLFQSINSKYNLGLESTFNSMFSRVNNNVLSELLRGNIYKDNLGLSDRLWIDSKYMKKDIQQVIMEGIASKKSSYELAKDLEKYVNPDSRKDWDWGKVYPNTRKRVDYNAQRLARTSVQHAYQMALKRSSSDNPFIEGLQYQSALSHRTCELCKERHGRIYKADSAPYDHPNGMCVLLPVITKSFEDIGSILRDYVDGKNNKYTEGIDKWLDINS